MKDWLSSAEGQEFSGYLRSGCAEGGLEAIVVPLPFAFVEQALTYTANKYDKQKGWNTATTKVPFRISIVCDGTKLYMSFCCIDTGLISNLYTPVENVRPFSVLLGGKTRNDALFLQVKKQAITGNFIPQDDSFVLYVSSEVFAIVHKKSSWRNRLTNRNRIFDEIVQRERLNLSPSGAGIGIIAYTGMRPFRAVDNDEIVEYRRSKNVTINFGLTQQELIDKITPESIVGTQPKHGRWLMNRAATSNTNEKGELIIHFKENTVGFCGASPASEELTLEYGNHGSGRERGKYRSYYNNGTEQSIVIQRDSIATKDLNAMANSCDEMYFGVSSNKSLIGWKYNDVLMLWQQDIMATEIHPLLRDLGSLKELGCREFRLPNVINVFTVPDYLTGYDKVDPELSEPQYKFLKRIYTARTNMLALDDKRTTDEERKLHRAAPKVVTPEQARLYVIWANDYQNEQSLRGKKLDPEEIRFIEYLANRAK